MDVLYELDDVRKVFDGATPVQAVAGVDLSIGRGEYEKRKAAQQART